MGDDNFVSPSFVALNQYSTYNHSLTSSVSTSNTAIWSDTASQSSDDTSVSNSDFDSCDSYCSKQPTRDNVVSNSRPVLYQPKADAAVPAELRQNPRRTGPGNRARAACPPPLVRQCDRKVNFVDSLVDSSTQIVETIWPLSSAACRSELGSKAVLPLRTFIQETLRRSRTSYSTLQVALYYLILIKPHVPQHNFTTEQPEDRHADRALQCGRRMFLAALILASKYLQDRNYSARAWSKISGLNTQEINQNEVSFLLAVNWKLHIADDVFQRWTEIVLKYTPPSSPPSPGGVPQTFSQQTLDWKNLILKLNPELNNIEGLIPAVSAASLKKSDLSALSPRSILNHPVDARAAFDSADVKNASLKSIVSPVNVEPIATAGRMAPSLGMLPTPRLTPQTSGICTPAVSAASQMLCKTGGAMSFAMAQNNCFSNSNAAQYLERIPTPVNSSPQSYCPARRSSLANSVSAASSPESMVSDTSRTSRSSSISSVSSLASATSFNAKLSGASRFRATKTWNDRASMKPTVPSVPEDHDERVVSSSPESYNGQVTKLGDLSLDTPLARRERELEEMARDPMSDAARALQDLHNQDVHSAESTPTTTSRKRASSCMTDGPLQDNVRDILNLGFNQPAWTGPRKRVRCATEFANGVHTAAVHPAISHQGNGIWDGILN